MDINPKKSGELKVGLKSKTWYSAFSFIYLYQTNKNIKQCKNTN